MSKCFNSFNAFLITTQQVIQLVRPSCPPHPQNNFIVTLGIDHLSKSPHQIPTSIVKVFDIRTMEILPYSHRFPSNPSCLCATDHVNGEFLLTDSLGYGSFFQLGNGLVETQQLTVGCVPCGALWCFVVLCGDGSRIIAPISRFHDSLPFSHHSSHHITHHITHYITHYITHHITSLITSHHSSLITHHIITSHAHSTQFNSMDNEFITSACISSSRDVVVATSIAGGIHVNARRPDWKVPPPLTPHSQYNQHSKPYPRPVIHRSTPIALEARGFGSYQPITLPTCTPLDIANIDLLRASSMDSFQNSLLDVPRMHHTLNPSLLEPNTQPGIKHLIKLKKRIVPNTIVFGQQKDMYVNVDPRKQHLKWSEQERVSEEDENTIPLELRFKEMKLNHYGFYDIDFTEYNK